MGRFWLLIWLTVLLLLAGIAFRQGSLIAMALPLVLYLAASLALMPEKVSLDVTRTLSQETATEGGPVIVHLSVANRGSSLEELRVSHPLPKCLELIGEQEPAYLALQPGERAEWIWTLTGLRGLHSLPPLRARICNSLGVFPLDLEIPAPARLTVLPEVIHLKRIPIRPAQTRPYPGPILSRKSGPGTDFYGLREYQTGDPLRWVNWRASAHQAEELLTNEFEREHIADVGIILDARQQTDVPGQEPLFEHSVRAAAALADAFISDGNRVSLLIYGYGVDQTFPGYGKIQRRRILQALAQATTGINYSLSSLGYLPTRLFPTRSQLVMISPLSLTDDQSLIRLRALGYEILIVSPNPVHYQASMLKGAPGVEEATRLALLERELLLRKLRRAGIQILDWQVSLPFERFIHPALRSQSAARFLGRLS